MDMETMALSSTLPSRKHRDRHEADPTERPVLTDPRDALYKAERFAQWSEQTPDDHFESVIHGAYFAMFHAARAALLAVQGTASTKHGRVAASFAQLSAAQDTAAQASVLAKARDLHANAHHGTEDLTQEGQALRAQMRPFLALCAGLVEERARA
jgi:uncharacterized protein (UPF0332 family)